MPELSNEALQELGASGLTAEEWSSFNWMRFSLTAPDHSWAGSSCGCPDVACAGKHHASGTTCSCLARGIANYKSVLRGLQALRA